MLAHLSVGSTHNNNKMDTQPQPLKCAYTFTDSYCWHISFKNCAIMAGNCIITTHLLCCVWINSTHHLHMTCTEEWSGIGEECVCVCVCVCVHVCVRVCVCVCVCACQLTWFSLWRGRGWPSRHHHGNLHKRLEHKEQEQPLQQVTLPHSSHYHTPLERLRPLYVKWYTS